MKSLDSCFNQVKEQEISGEVFQVTHRILQIPHEVYLHVLESSEDPYSETAAQEFVEQFLTWCGEQQGVIGMVRFDEKDGEIILDAAIRYRISPQERPVCQSCNELHRS